MKTKPEDTHVLLYANDLRGKGAFHKALNIRRREIHTLMEMHEGIDAVERIAAEFKNTNVWTYIYDRSVNVTIENVVLVRDITPILRRLAAVGFRRGREPTLESETRTVRWHLKRLNPDIRVDVVAHFNGEGENACTYTRVGTETKEVPVYKFTCPDGIKPEDWAPPGGEIDERGEGAA